MEISNFRLKVMIGIVVVLGIIGVLTSRNNKSNDANYQIVSGNGRTYYADTFRMVGRGLMFDDVYGRKVILTGNIDIEYRKKDK
jgi:hypothetical protein